MSLSKSFIKNITVKDVIIALAVLGLIITFIIIVLGRGDKPPAKKNNSSSGTNNGSYINNNNNNNNKPNGNPNSDCFVPESQKFNCMRVNGDDNHQDQFKCLNWRPDMLETGGCDELYSAFNDGTCDKCCQEYKDVYDQLCQGHIHDPVIHDPSKDRNNIPCGQDCSDVNKMSSCYAQFLNSNNQKCEFGSPKNSGNFASNCHNYGESQNLVCNTALTQACGNVLANANHCK